MARLTQYHDEDVALPPRGRASVAAQPRPGRVACLRHAAPVLHHELGAALVPPDAPLRALARGLDAARYVGLASHSRAAHSHAVHDMLAILSLPPQEQLPRAAVAVDYAPYVRWIHSYDVRQRAWDDSLRVTRQSARLGAALPAAPYARAWLPFGPAETAAAQRLVYSDDRN